MAEGISKLRFQRTSVKKVKPVLDELRGLSVKEVKMVLPYLKKKKIAVFIEKGLKAALASYRQKVEEALPEEDLIFFAKVDSGPILKRYRAGWRGRPMLIKKRLSHLTFEVRERR